ncbi:MAG: permease prefix domain 1-containing protein [Verrucomicrobiota bacterium]
MSRKRGLSSEVLDELESHLWDTYEELSIEFEEREAFQLALERLGDSSELGAEFDKVDPLISIENNMKNLLFGSVIAITGILAAVAMMGAGMDLFFHPAEISAVLMIPVGITVSSFGFSRFWNAFLCVVGKRDASRGSLIVLKRWISATYAAGGLAFLIGLSLSFVHLQADHFGVMVSASFTAPIIALVVSEVFLRSTLWKLQEHKG